MLNLPPPTLHLCDQYKEVGNHVTVVQDFSIQEAKPTMGHERSMVLKPLSFFSQRLPFAWDQSIPIGEEVDGLKIKSIMFNKRKPLIFKKLDVSVRATIDVVNTANHLRMPGFAIAVFDVDNRMLGVASGGTKIGGVCPGESAKFDLNFYQVVERISKAEYFYLSVELSK